MSRRRTKNPSAGTEGSCSAVEANAPELYHLLAGDESRWSNNGFIGDAIWVYRKRDGSVLVAGERVYKGANFIDLRLWVNGGATATTKGVALPRDGIESLAEALAGYAARTASKRGEPSS